MRVEDNVLLVLEIATLNELNKSKLLITRKKDNINKHEYYNRLLKQVLRFLSLG